MVGAYAVLGLDGRRGHPAEVRDALDGVEHRRLVGDELQGVAVAGADQHLHPLVDGLGRQGGDDVVRLVALDLHVRDLEGVEHLVQQRDLPLELVGVAERPALYSAYSSVRKVWRETSKATPTWVGCSSRRTLISIEVKP